MTISNGYADLATFKVRVGISAGGAHDGDAERVIEAASRAVDRWCGRRFWPDGTAAARYYTPRQEETTLLSVDDFYSTTGLVVESDDTDDGVYENTWTLNSRTGSYGFVAEPANAEADEQPYTRLKAVSGAAFPHIIRGVKVTAKWGWSSIPPEIVEATLILGSRWYKRKDTPFGVMGSQEVGYLTLPRVDPDVRVLISPYRRMDI